MSSIKETGACDLRCALKIFITGKDVKYIERSIRDVRSIGRIEVKERQKVGSFEEIRSALSSVILESSPRPRRILS